MEQFEKITSGELQILQAIRELKPYEKLEITADNQGKPDTYLVHRQTKYIVKGLFNQPVK